MSRGVTPVIGVVILLALTVVLAGSVGIALSMDPPSQPPTATFSATVTGDEIRLTHERGDVLDVTELDIRVAINETPLEHQPAVPFFAEEGFKAGPTGPFNAASTDSWRVGEVATFTIAQTNKPQITDNSEVTITVTTADIILFEETVRVEN